MAFGQYEKITAAGINSSAPNFIENPGHQGWSYTTRDWYFYTVRDSGQLVYYSSSRSGGCFHECQLKKWINNDWQRVDFDDGSGGLKSAYYGSGQGAYNLHLWYHNNDPYVEMYPSYKNCEQNKKIAAMSGGPYCGTNGGAATGISPRCSDQLTVNVLNSGRCYTI